MTECDRLCPLKMGVTRHNNALIFLRLVAKDLDKTLDFFADFVNFLFKHHSYIKRYLIVT